ncbi:synaptotagmin-15-like [Antedon mediterranea]|uniref:synaptotagmin-15-like n=1 Tax=Antedon mediterranea TaxID=105859 RepID=UPI003AF94478
MAEANDVGLIIGSLCGGFVILGLVFLLFRIYNSRCRSQSKYERIGPRLVPPAVQIESRCLATPSINLKTVPFMVPMSTPRDRSQTPAVSPGFTQISKDLSPENTAALSRERRLSVPGPERYNNNDRRPSFTERRPSYTEQRLPLYDDFDSRRSSTGSIISACSDTTDGSSPPLHSPARRLSYVGCDVTSPLGAYVGEINPELYKLDPDEDEANFPDDHIGRIWFAVEYELEAERLVVSLIKAKNLPSRVHGSSSQCDPLVKMFLLPEERRHLQSKVKRKTTNPKFDESFVFQVTYKALQQRTLRLSVYDVDRSKRHKLIGHAMYALRELACEAHQKIVMWLDLEKEVSEGTPELGELQFSLNYNNYLERLTVVVIEAKGLKPPEDFLVVDASVKVSLMNAARKVIKTKKTEVVRKTNSPTFNESFHFKVAPDSLDVVSICLTVLQNAPKVKGDKTIGRVVVGSFMMARGREMEHWNEMTSQQKQTVTKWHVLS